MAVLTMRCGVHVPERQEQIINQDHNSEFRTDFIFFEDLLGRIPWDMARKRSSGAQVDFQDHFLQAQVLSILTSRKASKSCRKPAWMNKKHLNKPRYKKGRTLKLEAGSNHSG